jgi:ankyrin repeat protein
MIAERAVGPGRDTGRAPGRMQPAGATRAIRALAAIVVLVVANALIGSATALAAAPMERDKVTSENDTMLIAAAEKGDLEGIAKALRSGASIAARDSRGRIALLAATYGNHVPASLFLMAAGSDVNAKDHDENSAFLLAAAQGYLDILKLTLRSGADLKSTNRFGGTALIPAAHYGHVAVVRELLATPIPVDHVNKLGWTALLEAIILGDGGAKHTEIVQMLVSAKANVNLADKDGVTPLQHAKKKNQAAIVKILEAAGAK